MDDLHVRIIHSLNHSDFGLTLLNAGSHKQKHSKPKNLHFLGWMLIFFFLFSFFPFLWSLDETLSSSGVSSTASRRIFIFLAECLFSFSFFLSFLFCEAWMRHSHHRESHRRWWDSRWWEWSGGAFVWLLDPPGGIAFILPSNNNIRDTHHNQIQR